MTSIAPQIMPQANAQSQAADKPNGATQLVKALEKEGVEYIFGYPGA